MAERELKFKVRIARIDQGGSTLQKFAPDWPTDRSDRNLFPYLKDKPRELRSLNKIAGGCRSTSVEGIGEQVLGPCIEAIIDHDGCSIRLCGELPDLPTNSAGERVRLDMDLILVFRDAEPGGRPAHVELRVHGLVLASAAL